MFRCLVCDRFGVDSPGITNIFKGQMCLLTLSSGCRNERLLALLMVVVTTHLSQITQGKRRKWGEKTGLMRGEKEHWEELTMKLGEEAAGTDKESCA